MQEKASESDIEQMLEICLSGYEESRQSKQYKQICNLFLKQILESEKNQKNQQTNIQIIVYSDLHSNQQTNQSFIMSCLLFLFVKYRSLKVMFDVYTDQKIKYVNYQKNIVLDLKQIKLKPEFYRKFCEFISKKEREYHHSFNFFKEICFKTNWPYSFIPPHTSKQKFDCYRMISEFYQQLSYIMNNKKIYLLKNTLIVFPIQQATRQEAQYFNKIIQQLSQIYVLVHVFKNAPQSLLVNLAQYQRKQISSPQMQIEQEEQTLEKGFFKQFNGSTMQYLQKLVLVFQGTSKEIANLTKFLQKTPNLSSLQLHRLVNTVPQILLPHAQNLLETLVQHVPLIKKITFLKFRVENIQLELLHRLYVKCPYLVQLNIGLAFEHSIMETYQIQNFSDKKALELEREKLLMLQALRLRNITLHNSTQTFKLLLKKGYNFLSALEIIYCIEPICV